jgi:hypothetical protein
MKLRLIVGVVLISSAMGAGLIFAAKPEQTPQTSTSPSIIWAIPVEPKDTWHKYNIVETVAVKTIFAVNKNWSKYGVFLFQFENKDDGKIAQAVVWLHMKTMLDTTWQWPLAMIKDSKLTLDDIENKRVTFDKRLKSFSSTSTFYFNLYTTCAIKLNLVKPDGTSENAGKLVLINDRRTLYDYFLTTVNLPVGMTATWFGSGYRGHLELLSVQFFVRQ